MFKQWLKNQYYVKIFISIITFSMVTVISLSVVFSNIYSKSLYDQTIKDNIARINKMNVGFDNLNKEMDQLYTMLEMDINVYTYLNQYVNDNITKIYANIYANKICQINPYIDSIVLCNVKMKDYVLVGNEGFDPTKTVEKEKQNINNKVGTKNFESNVVNIDDSLYKGEKHLISLIYNETSSDKKTIESMIIINLNWDLVQEGIMEKSNDLTFICDNMGNVLSPEDKNKLEIQSVKEKYFTYISKINETVGSFNYKINNKEKVITFFKNKENDWNIIDVKSYEDITSSLKQKRNVIIIIVFMILSVCLLMGYFISKMLYSPIKKITDIFKLSKYAQGMKSGGELALISEVYKEALKDVLYLEKKNESNIPKIKENFLRGLLRNKQDVDGLDNKLRDYHVEIKFEQLYIVVINSDYNNKDVKNQSIYETTTITSLIKLLENDFDIEVVNMLGGELCLLLNFKDEASSFEVLVTCLERTKSLVNNILGGSLTMGIGGVVNSIEDCVKVYARAQDMVKYRFVLGYDKIIYQKYIDDNLTNSFNYPKEIEKKLILSINESSRENFIKHLEEIVGILKNYIYQDSVIIFLQIVMECIKKMNQVTGGSKLLKIDFDEFNLMFRNLQTLDEAEKWFIKIFDEHQNLLKEIDSIKGNKFYKMVEEVKTYIDDNYKDVNLCVEVLAENAGYTPNYFAKKFKSITGQYIIDYIKQQRITKAKELLKTSNYSINDISTMVGFINPTYFYSAFKKSVGLTPTSYRNYKTSDEDEI